ncbi:hypothetical protein CMUST_02730 [Corynebacterium mustelae]|uniref:Uncharacterized protein n=1 Tax=Corynebacterium mustelae TaxID=571915 RepID=A0A0G3GWI2_9CORY|nr:hypothetical protein [Corynebacterium mustelae]AKK04890.1 hypothetical protein CMUST_02730 [Corynebacterium mustelae]
MSKRSSLDEQRVVLSQVLVKYGLPNSLPSRHVSVSDDVVLAMVEHAPEIISDLLDYPMVLGEFVSCLDSHVKAKHASRWDAVVAAFHALPSREDGDRLKGDDRVVMAVCLGRLAGGSKKRVAELVGLIASGDARDFLFVLMGLLPKLSQEQWDVIAPKFDDFETQSSLRINVAKTREKLVKNGVVPWFPSVVNEKLEQHPEIIVGKIDALFKGLADKTKDSHNVASVIFYATPYLSQEQWDRLVPLVKTKEDKKSIALLVDAWADVLAEKGINPWLP